jgi:hypothetical protein
LSSQLQFWLDVFFLIWLFEESLASALAYVEVVNLRKERFLLNDFSREQSRTDEEDDILAFLRVEANALRFELFYAQAQIDCFLVQRFCEVGLGYYLFKFFGREYLTWRELEFLSSS